MSVYNDRLSDDHARAPVSLAELEQFLLENPGVQYLDCVFADLCGAIRGKRVARDDLERIFKSGIAIPASIYFLDARGDPVELKDETLAEGRAWPVPGTLSRVNWSQRPHGQMLMTLTDAKGAPHAGEPRNVLRRVAARFAELDLVPVVAAQLEFFLLDTERTKLGLLQPPKASAPVVQDDFATEIADAAETQSLPPTTLSQMSPDGQFEIGIEAVPDAIRAGDHAVFVRQIVRAVARRVGRDASFMAKPFLDLAGNGMRIRVGMRHRSGKDVFDDNAPDGSELMRFAIGGLQAVMAESIALFAPSVNSHRRFMPPSSVPRNKRWSVRDEKAGLRAVQLQGKARRIEHNVAGADANPYLVIAAVLAGMHHGISQGIDPGPAYEGDALAFVDQTLPSNIDAALLTLENGSILREYLGPAYVDLYCATKRAELDRFRSFIPAHEYDWYV